MTTKLNLTIDEGLVKDVKLYAKKRKTSVSKVVQEQLYGLFGKKENNKKESFVEKHQRMLQKYAGKSKGKFDDLDRLRDEYLKEKYGV